MLPYHSSGFPLSNPRSFLLLFFSISILSISSASGQSLQDPDDVTSPYGDPPEVDAREDPEGCPRDREQAATMGRQCLRKCHVDADCISPRKHCLCDGLCGWSCVRPDLHCDPLTPVENGDFQLTGDHFGARVTYSCHEGFFMSGLKERVCQGDSSWSHRAPECRKKAMCGPPPTLPHARHSAPQDQTDFAVESTVEYSCFLGYDPQGEATARCRYHNGTTQWMGLELRCIPRSCGPPGEVEHARREGDTFTFTSRVTYHCVEGYELVGRANRYCQTDGQWSGVLPACRPIQCPAPQDPPNGRAVYTVTSYNSVVLYECHYGFRLSGPTTRNCGPNKQWEGPDPVCEEIDCGSPGVLYNGFLKGSNTRLGAVVLFRCLDGMTMEGPHVSTTCTQNGNWSHPLPKCLAPCTIPEVEEGRVENEEPGARANHGQNITVICNEGYDLAYLAARPVCNNGTWTHAPKCIPARCKRLPKVPRFGRVIAPKTDHGTKVLYQCLDGFTLKGPNVTECKFGNWTGETPKCKEVYCPFPGYLKNGRILLIGHMGMYDYRPYVTKIANNRQIMYECDRHYILDPAGPQGATCVDGQWSPQELPDCLPGSHPHVVWIRSIHARRRRRQVLLWRQNNRRKPKRNHEPCNTVPSAPWMDVQVVRQGRGASRDNPTPHGTVIEVTCYHGYRLNLGANRTARCAHGRWRPREPTCLTLPCHVPETSSSGHYQHFELSVAAGAEIPHGEVISLSCLPGHQLVGPESLRCWYGDWTGTRLPECVPGPCELPTIPNGHYLGGYRAGLTISHGSTIEFECEPGNGRVNALDVRCIQGQLRPERPLCRPIAAHPPDGDDGGSFSSHFAASNEDSSKMDFEAHVGHRPCHLPRKSRNILFYHVEGDEDEDEHEESEEEEDEVVYSHESEVRFKCLKTKEGQATSWKLVCEDGVWLGRSYKCDPDDNPNVSIRDRNCTLRQNDPNVVAFHEDRRVTEGGKWPPGSVLVFRCRDIGKFRFVGSVRRRCDEGVWDGATPACLGLSQENDYALEKPPTILFRHHMGQIAQTNDGKLLVYPSTVLHLECLWIRKFGSPRWNYTHTDRTYPVGWTDEPDRDPQLEFRLSIYHAQSQDSGRYTCITPAGHRHTVDIVVQAVDCPPIHKTPGLISIPPGYNTRLNTKLAFSCERGYILEGSEQATCLPSGRWSASPPQCIARECPSLLETVPPPLLVDAPSRDVGSTATFSCPEGMSLRGSRVISCLDTGQWSDEIPRCTKSVCLPLDVPPQVKVVGAHKPRYHMGDILQFSCETGYILEGAMAAVCQDSGAWTAPIPKCRRSCSYPGPTRMATLSPVKFYYYVNETVELTCADGYKLSGPGILQCMEDGTWSRDLPECLLEP